MVWLRGAFKWFNGDILCMTWSGPTSPPAKDPLVDGYPSNRTSSVLHRN